MSTGWLPNENDLEPWAKRNLERAYQARERKQASREDFAAGYIAALIDVRSSSQFKPGRWMPDGDLPW